MKQAKYFLYMMVLLASCKATHPVATNTYREVTQKELIRKVEVATEGDTAVAVYRLIYPKTAAERADTMFQVQLEKVSETKGKYTQAPKVSIRNNQLVITAVAEPQIIPVEVKDTFTTEKEVTVKTEIITTNTLTSWQCVRVWIGNIILVLLVLLAVIQFLRIKQILKF